jgi:hypothetical protein
MNRREYLLICLMEECNELSQAAAKCLRFGVDNTHPVFKTHNTDKMFSEWMDVEAVTDLLAEEMGITITHAEADAQKRKKIKKVEKYILESKDLRILGK